VKIVSPTDRGSDEEEEQDDDESADNPLNVIPPWTLAREVKNLKGESVPFANLLGTSKTTIMVLLRHFAWYVVAMMNS
jgi:hypothetical protein